MEFSPKIWSAKMNTPATWLQNTTPNMAWLKELSQSEWSVSFAFSPTIALLLLLSSTDDPCTRIHCGAGRVCQVQEDSAQCVCIPDCPEENDPRRKVCTNRNETWGSDCEVHRQRCLCDTKDARCSNMKNSHIHIDYYGECKQLQVGQRKFCVTCWNLWQLRLDSPLCYKIPFSCETVAWLTRKYSKGSIWGLTLPYLSPSRHALKKKCSISRVACANGSSRSWRNSPTARNWTWRWWTRCLTSKPSWTRSGRRLPSGSSAISMPPMTALSLVTSCSRFALHWWASSTGEGRAVVCQSVCSVQ